jgi:hypothetical protein
MTHEADIMRGRLALALVSARAKHCPDRRCARQRHCLAELKRGSNFHTRLGNCPIMTEAEWSAVSLGMQRVCKEVHAYLRSLDEPEDKSWRRLSPEERYRRSNSPTAVTARAAAEEEAGGWRWSYRSCLWTEVGEKGQSEPANIPAYERALINYAVAHGCRCAKEGQVVEGCRCERAARPGS